VNHRLERLGAVEAEGAPGDEPNLVVEPLNEAILGLRHLLLSEVGDGAIKIEEEGSLLRIGREREVTLRRLPGLSQLATLISIRRRKEFRDAATMPDPQRVLVMAEGHLVTPGTEPSPSMSRGLAVFRSDYVAFIPPIPAAQILDAMTEPVSPMAFPPHESRDEVPLSLSQLLEHLRCLPEEHMDALLRKAASPLPESFLWEMRTMDWKREPPGSLELSGGGKVLRISPLASDVRACVAEWEHARRLARG